MSKCVPFIFLIFFSAVFDIASANIPQMPVYSENNYVKVAVLQWSPALPSPVTDMTRAEQHKQRNRETIYQYAKQAKKNGAELLITPELAVSGYPQDGWKDANTVSLYVETIPGPTTRYFSKVSAELKMYIHVGFPEVDVISGSYYNAVVAFGPDGSLLAKYRKIRLFGDEYKYFDKGTKPASYEGPFGRIGLIICADVYNRFPISSYRAQGIDTVAMGASWTVKNAIQDFSEYAAYEEIYLLAANTVYFPGSGVFNPDGKTQASSTSQGLVYGSLLRKK